MITAVTLNASIDKLYVVEKFVYGTVQRVKQCEYTPGGKGINVAKVAHIAGSKVTATGFVGGHAGRYVVEKLSDQGITCDFVETENETRSCINMLDEHTGKHTELLEPGSAVSKEDVESFFAKFQKLVNGSAVITISGSVPKGVDESVYAELIRAAKAKNKKVILDTSGQLLTKGIEGQPTMIKPNEDELGQLVGRTIQGEKEIISAATELHEKGIEIVVVSLGEKGAILVSEKGVFLGKAPRLDPVNTVGCGDSMVAGFSVGMEKNESIEQMFQRAIAVSAANALQVKTGFYTNVDYQRLFDEVVIKKI